jgi:outer membrane immunogenic protein
MKKLLLSAVSLAVLTGSAIAADLPTRKEPLPAPPPSFTWTGLYGGINVGYGFGAGGNDHGSLYGTNTTTTGLTALTTVTSGLSSSWNNSMSPSGVVGGGQIGYNYQYNPYIVVGVEADAQASDMNGSNGYYGSGTGLTYVTTAKNIDWFGTARGRLGLTMPGYSNFLVYGTGGFAYGQVDNNVGVSYLMANGGASGTSSFYQTKTGWTAGGGVEWSPQSFPTWSAKVEYLYTNLGSTNQNIYSTYSNPAGTFFGANHQSPTQFNTVRVGLNWHFNPFVGAPIVAKY